MARVVEVSGALHVTLDERTIEVTADGSRVRAEIGDIATGRPSIRLAASSFVLARRLSRSLDRSALTLVITRAGVEVAELGAGVRGGRLARFLGMPNVRVRRVR